MNHHHHHQLLATTANHPVLSTNSHSHKVKKKAPHRCQTILITVEASDFRAAVQQFTTPSYLASPWSRQNNNGPNYDSSITFDIAKDLDVQVQSTVRERLLNLGNRVRGLRIRSRHKVKRIEEHEETKKEIDPVEPQMEEVKDQVPVKKEEFKPIIHENIAQEPSFTFSANSAFQEWKDMKCLQGLASSPEKDVGHKESKTSGQHKQGKFYMTIRRKQLDVVQLQDKEKNLEKIDGVVDIPAKQMPQNLSDCESDIASELVDPYSGTDSEDEKQKIKIRRELLSEGFTQQIMHASQMHGQIPTCTSEGSGSSINMAFTAVGQRRKPAKGYADIDYNWVLANIFEYIKKPDVGKVGIHGCHKIGKTTLVEAFRKSKLIRNAFVSFVTVTIPKNWDVKDMQMAIAAQIFSDHNETDEKDISYLLKSMKFLLILNMDRPLNLEKVGIPKPTPENGSKIVLLTGSEQVCQEMAVDQMMSLDDILSWELFCQNMSEVVHSAERQATARKIVKLCCHSSHAIILMAGALKNETDISIWKSAVEKLSLQSSSDEENLEELISNVLKFSIEHLEDDRTRNCLKNLSLKKQYEEIAMESLICNWIKQGFTDTFSNGKKVLKSLLESNILEIDESKHSIKLQDIYREIIINLIVHPEESRMFQMKGGLRLTEAPKVEEWASAKVICLMQNAFSKLPENPNCPSLSTLFLQKNPNIRNIPCSFFNSMPTLQVLNLSSTRIKSLPASLSNLVSLKKLFLCNCILLRKLPPEIGKLGLLEVIDLHGTKMMDLPRSIENLANLTSLEVSICVGASHKSALKQSTPVIPHGVLSALSNLEEVNIEVDPDEDWWDLCAESLMKEVCTLKRLATLKLYFPTVKLLNKFNHLRQQIVHHQLFEFRFVLGNDANRIMSRLKPSVDLELERYSRYLKYVNGEGIPQDVKDVLKHADAFFLDQHVNIQKLSKFGSRCLEKLKCCVLGECNELQILVDGMDISRKDEFGNIRSNIFLGSLEYLHLYYMRNLQTIWEGPMNRGCLSNLKYLSLQTCPKLTTVLTQGMLDNLCSLEELVVEDCPTVTSLITTESFVLDLTSFYLPKLKRMSLHYLRALSSISSGLSIAPNLEYLSFYDCPNLKSLSANEASSKKLRKIRGEQDWWKDLVRQDNLDSLFVAIGSDEVV